MLKRLRSIFFFQESGLLLVVVLLGVLFTLKSEPATYVVMETGADGTPQPVMTTNPDGEKVPLRKERNKFLNAQSLAQLAKDTSFIGIMAVGMAVVIISGGIDLSVGAAYALAAVLAAKVMHYYGPLGDGHLMSPLSGTLLGMAVCIGTGVLCGLVNGGLVVLLRVHPFIITLGTMAIFRGIAFVVTGGQSVTDFPTTDGKMAVLQGVIKHETGNELYLVPPAVMLLVMVVGWLFLRRLAAGRRVFAVGGNEIAARFSGIRVENVKLGVYLISGLCAGISALMSLGYYGSGSSGDGNGYELDVVAAAVVGGASLMGGRGSALGAVLGALVIQMITHGIILLNIDQNYSRIIIGIAVIAAVVMDNVNTALARRRLARHAG